MTNQMTLKDLQKWLKQNRVDLRGLISLRFRPEAIIKATGVCILATYTDGTSTYAHLVSLPGGPLQASVSREEFTSWIESYGFSSEDTAEICIGTEMYGSQGVYLVAQVYVQNDKGNKFFLNGVGSNSAHGEVARQRLIVPLRLEQP